MNLYGLDGSLFELGFSDPSLIESISSSHSMITSRRDIEREEEDLLKLSNSILKNLKRNNSPPKSRHDGTSPLPLGMDWSPPPRNWVISVIYWVWVCIKKMNCYLLLEMLACLIAHMNIWCLLLGIAIFEMIVLSFMFLGLYLICFWSKFFQLLFLICDDDSSEHTHI